jgi:CubicO group peptidase (beta-lactamase class C family)
MNAPGSSAGESQIVHMTHAAELERMPKTIDLARAGCDPERLARLIERFRRQQSDGVFPGGQLVVVRRGVTLADEAVGIARGFRPEEGEPAVPYTRETKAGLFSAGKPLVAVALALLESRGQIDVLRPVRAYFPEFGANGKADISVRDVLLHRSGLYLRDIERDYRHYGDWEGVIARVAAATPKFPRGTLAYQPMGFGWILGEIVRRVTTLPIELFLERELCAPAGLGDLRLGVPAAEVPELARSYWVDEKPPVLGGEVMTGFEQAQNSVEQLTAVLPGAGTVGTARSLAAFYAWLLAGTPAKSGGRLITPEVLARYVTPQTSGIDRTVRVPMVLGRGFAFGWFFPHPYGWWNTGKCYGHAGNFSTIGWADPTTGCAVAVVTNGNRPPLRLVPRFAPLGSALRAACVA